MIVDSTLPCVKFGPNDHREDTPRLYPCLKVIRSSRYPTLIQILSNPYPTETKSLSKSLKTDSAYKFGPCKCSNKWGNR